MSNENLKPKLLFVQDYIEKASEDYMFPLHQAGFDLTFIQNAGDADRAIVFPDKEYDILVTDYSLNQSPEKQKGLEIMRMFKEKFPNALTVGLGVEGLVSEDSWEDVPDLYFPRTSDAVTDVLEISLVYDSITEAKNTQPINIGDLL